MRSKHVAFVVLTVAAILASTAIGRHVQAAARVRTTGIFSSLRYDDQTGDLLGMEVFLFPDHALVQCAGGGLPAPALVAAKVEGSRVSFTLPDGLPECGTRFQGMLSTSGLRGSFGEQHGDLWLPRKQSYWQ